MGLPAPRPGAAALITGASSGVGREVACALAERGHDVVLLARRTERLVGLAAQLEADAGVRAEPVTCDLSERADRRAAVGAVAALGLEVDVLANCAGLGLTGPFHRHPPGSAVAMVATNFEAAVDLTAAFAPGMAQRRSGAVLFVSSLAGVGPVPGFAAYAATKAAVTSLAEALHVELRPLGVTVSVVSPGPVDTEFGAVADLEGLMERTPSRLTVTARDCARVALDGLERERRVTTPNGVVRALGAVGAHVPHRVGLPVWRRVFGV